MATLIYNGTTYELGETNTDLAYLHAVTEFRFREGRGFTLGLFVTNNKGEFIRHWFWIHPSISIEFIYSPGETIQLDGELFDLYLASTESPFGLLIGDYSPADLPFSFEETKAAEAATGTATAEN